MFKTVLVTVPVLSVLITINPIYKTFYCHDFTEKTNKQTNLSFRQDTNPVL